MNISQAQQSLSELNTSKRELLESRGQYISKIRDIFMSEKHLKIKGKGLLSQKSNYQRDNVQNNQVQTGREGRFQKRKTDDYSDTTQKNDLTIQKEEIKKKSGEDDSEDSDKEHAEEKLASEKQKLLKEQEERDQQKSAVTQDDKRKFGFVLNFLNQAQTTLESEKDIISQQDELQKQQETEQIKEIEVLRQEKINVLDQQKEKIIEKRRKIDTQLLDLERDIAAQKIDISFYFQSKFYRTQTNPPIYWASKKPPSQKFVQENQTLIDELRNERINYVRDAFEKYKLEKEKQLQVEQLDEKLTLLIEDEGIHENIDERRSNSQEKDTQIVQNERRKESDAEDSD